MTESVLFLNRSAVRACVAALDVSAVIADVLRDHTAKCAVISGGRLPGMDKR
jgi:hypothetical protein